MSSHPDEASSSAGAGGPKGVTPVTPRLLRQWPLPSPADSKYGRGKVLILGGAARTPGAALLAGIAVLRVGAGHLTLAVAESAAVALAVALPEAGVVGLPQNAEGSVRGDRLGAAADSFHDVDVLLVGPGLDDAVETAAMLRNILPLLDERTQVVLDAYTLGVLAQVPSVTAQLAGRLVLTPNKEEGGRLLGREVSDAFRLADDVADIAARYGATVSCHNVIADRTATGGRSAAVMRDWPRRAAAMSWPAPSPGSWRAVRLRTRQRAGARIYTPLPGIGWPAGSASWAFWPANSSTSCPSCWSS